MSVSERRRVILNVVYASGMASLRELAGAVRSSMVTVRRDVRSLEADGLLERLHGGAMVPAGRSSGAGDRHKTDLAVALRTDIARAAAGLVSDGETIMVAAGDVAQEFARCLRCYSGLTVITNSLLVARSLAQSAGIEVLVTSGSVDRQTFALVGPALETSLAGLHVNRAFLCGDGLTVTRGLSASNMLAGSADGAIAETAGEVIVLADHTKFGVDRICQTVPTERFSAVVTDSLADPVAVEALRCRGIEVHVASADPSERRDPL